MRAALAPEARRDCAHPWTPGVYPGAIIPVLWRRAPGCRACGVGRPLTSDLPSFPARAATPDPLDGIIEEIGFGNFQLTMYIAVGLAIIADGAEMLNVALITQALGEEWGLSATQKGALGSTIFIGFTLGSLAAGRVGDKHGRKFPLLFFVSMLFIMGFASAFAVNYESLLVLRAFVGFAIGGAVVLINTLFAEFLPSDHRGRWLILNSLFFPAGEIVAAFLAWSVPPRAPCPGPPPSRVTRAALFPRLTMPNFERGQWRAMLALCSIPAFICFVFGVAWLPESPRYLLEVGDIDETEVVIKRMAIANGKPVPDLTPLRNYEGAAESRRHDATRGNLSELVKPHLRVLTFTLAPLWFCVALVFYGLVYYLPIIFGEQDARGEGGTSAHLDIVISALVEVPSTLFVAATVDNPSFGRTGLISASLTGALISLCFTATLPFGAGTRTPLLSPPPPHPTPLTARRRPDGRLCLHGQALHRRRLRGALPLHQRGLPHQRAHHGARPLHRSHAHGRHHDAAPRGEPPTGREARSLLWCALLASPFPPTPSPFPVPRPVMLAAALVGTISACCLPFDTAGMTLSEIQQGMMARPPDPDEEHPFAKRQVAAAEEDGDEERLLASTSTADEEPKE